MAMKKPENLSFEDAISELENIVAVLEQGELPLEDALTRFERGVRLARTGRERLEQAQQRIQILLGNDEQAPLTRFTADDSL